MWHGSIRSPRDRRAGRLLRRRVLRQPHLLARVAHRSGWSSSTGSASSTTATAPPTRPSSASAARCSCARTARTPCGEFRPVLRQRPGLRPRPVAGGLHRADAADRRQPAAGHRADARLPRVRRRLPAPAVPARPRRPAAEDGARAARPARRGGRAGAAQGVRGPQARRTCRTPRPTPSLPAAQADSTGHEEVSTHDARDRRRHGRPEPAVVDPAAGRPARRGRPTGALRLHGEHVEVEVVELRDLAHDITDHLLTGFPRRRAGGRRSTRSRRPTRVIAVTPIFSASYSGLFKSFFDVLEDGRARRQAGAARRDRRHRPALAGAGVRAAAAVRLPAAPSSCRPRCSRPARTSARRAAVAGSRRGSSAPARELADLVLGRPATAAGRPVRQPDAVRAAAARLTG